MVLQASFHLVHLGLIFLKQNSKLDFISHHAYAVNPKGNSTCLSASFRNVTEISTTLQRLASIWAEVGQPITFGEFGSRTTSGLGALYGPALQTDEATVAVKAQEEVPSPLSCNLTQNCISGVASTIGWFLTHGKSVTECGEVWNLAIIANEGPTSKHHRCPVDYAGSTFDDATYAPCKDEIIVAGKVLEMMTCVPAEPPPCVVVDFQSGAAWDFATWLTALSSGYDGAIRWALTEKPYVLGAQADTWIGDNQRDPVAHDAYASGSRFGLEWFDGTARGQPKPLVFALRFLAQYLRTSTSWAEARGYSARMDGGSGGNTGNITHSSRLIYFEQQTYSSGVIGAGYTYTGADCIFAAGHQVNTSSMRFNAMFVYLNFLKYSTFCKATSVS